MKTRRALEKLGIGISKSTSSEWRSRLLSPDKIDPRHKHRVSGRGKSYSDEYKRKVAEFSRDEGPGEAHKKYGIGRTTIDRFRSELELETTERWIECNGPQEGCYVKLDSVATQGGWPANLTWSDGSNLQKSPLFEDINWAEEQNSGNLIFSTTSSADSIGMYVSKILYEEICKIRFHHSAFTPLADIAAEWFPDSHDPVSQILASRLFYLSRIY